MQVNYYLEVRLMHRWTDAKIFLSSRLYDHSHFPNLLGVGPHVVGLRVESQPELHYYYRAWV